MWLREDSTPQDRGQYTTGQRTVHHRTEDSTPQERGQYTTGQSTRSLSQNCSVAAAADVCSALYAPVKKSNKNFNKQYYLVKTVFSGKRLRIRKRPHGYKLICYVVLDDCRGNMKRSNFTTPTFPAKAGYLSWCVLFCVLSTTGRPAGLGTVSFQLRFFSTLLWQPGVN
jgi:hypothetical protein